MQKLLVIDDDKITHSFIKRALDGSYDLYAGFNGEEGLEQVDSIDPDIILLDVEMPGMNGYEVCEIIKSRENSRNTPVIFLSSHSSLRERMQGFEAGADDYVVKPFQPEELTAKLNVVSRYRKTEEELTQQVAQAKETAYTALSGSSDLGKAIYFIEQCHSVKNFDELASEFFKITSSLQLVCTIAVKSITGEFYFSSTQNTVPPLEAELVTKLRDEGRFFDFGCRTQINYQNIALLIKNMPLDDMDRYGRIKDLFPAMLSAADTKVTQLDTLSSIQQQAEELTNSSQMITKALTKIKSSINETQKSSIKVMRDMLMELDQRLPGMGLEDDQEQYLLDRIDNAITEAHKTSSDTKELSKYFSLIVENLESLAAQQLQLANKLASFSCKSEEEEGYAMDVELF